MKRTMTKVEKEIARGLDEFFEKKDAEEIKQARSIIAKANANKRWAMKKYKTKKYRKDFGKKLREAKAVAKVKRFEA